MYMYMYMYICIYIYTPRKECCGLMRGDPPGSHTDSLPGEAPPPCSTPDAFQHLQLTVARFGPVLV